MTEMLQLVQEHISQIDGRAVRYDMAGQIDSRPEDTNENGRAQKRRTVNGNIRRDIQLIYSVFV